MTSRWLESIVKLPIAPNRPWIGYAAALVACLLGLGLRFLVDGALGGGYPFITFVPFVVLAAFLFGWGPGLFAGVLSWLAARYFVIPPVHSLQLTKPSAVSILLYGLIVGLQIAIIHFFQVANHALREQRELSRRHSAQREAMFHELQHRISNKLQIIASLLSLQRRMVNDPDAKKALDDAALRVGMIGRISRALHDPDRAGLDVVSFLEQVGRDIIRTSGAPDVRLLVEADPGVEFTDASGVPVALIVCEAISNALEHGFRASGQGSIAIAVRQRGLEGIVITVTDDGCGIDADFDAEKANSLGLRIATTLARQLDGRFSLRPAREGGTVAELRIAA
jgi:two-component sensor histidine kinase